MIATMKNRVILVVLALFLAFGVFASVEAKPAYAYWTTYCDHYGTVHSHWHNSVWTFGYGSYKMYHYTYHWGYYNTYYDWTYLDGWSYRGWSYC